MKLAPKNRPQVLSLEVGEDAGAAFAEPHVQYNGQNKEYTDQNLQEKLRRYRFVEQERVHGGKHYQDCPASEHGQEDAAAALYSRGFVGPAEVGQLQVDHQAQNADKHHEHHRHQAAHHGVLKAQAAGVAEGRVEDHHRDDGKDLVQALLGLEYLHGVHRQGLEQPQGLGLQRNGGRREVV